ncbi:metallophosphoesterase [Saccharococcus sp. Marseille-Q5394]|uniref:metallophosphoesterase n=1 Tax=Saccharococcus sp. Marseille-Q5394 TaxID=2972778 RepID=UPI0021C8ADED|nr:metallophosphoesterase [Saccharococcus sp. Marseille-Q5394]
MRILHLSDVHFTKGHKNFHNYVLEPLFKDIHEMHNEIPIELVLFTGDLLDKGGYPKEPLESFESFESEFIDKLLKTLSLPRERFIFIPGNHDIDRKKINPLTERGLKTSLVTANEIELHMETPQNLNLERIEDYKLFENIYYSDYENYKDNGFGYSIILDINNLKIGIAGFNTAWRCFDDKDKTNLIMGKKQITQVDAHLGTKELDYKIALMHHPFEFLCESEYEPVKDYILRDYDILFTGHTHQSNAQSITTSLGKGCILCAAPSNWEKNNFQNHGLNRNGYNIININNNEKSITIHFRRYNYDKNRFVDNTDLGMEDTAYSTFHLGDVISRESWMNFTNTITYIKDNFLEVIEQNLVSYNTDTIAPKQLKDLFVLPIIKIGNYHTDDNTEFSDFRDNSEVLSFNKLCNYDRNLVMFGQSESGKTTLLYRIALEILENSYVSKKIPVFIDLKTIASRSIFKKVSQFLGRNLKSTTEILEKNNTVLLLDNLRYIISNEKLYNELNEMLTKYPKMKIIATYDSLSQENLPSEFLGHPISKQVDIANIEYFRSTEIQTLMQRWFNKESEKVEDENLIQIIKNFHLLNIPSTPLAVSLFLWIYEKQKGFIPRNNAAMVQNFVEKLFEKHSESDVQSSKFDFHNKDNLLGHIAMEMYHLGAENYVIEEEDLRNFIKNLNNKKKIGLETQGTEVFHEWVIKYFVEKGILLSEIRENGRVYKFKLNCFFQYYLAKAMTFSKEFKELVLSEERYLEFQNEIDYYSGLHRHDGEILDLVVSRMEREYMKLFKETEVFEKVLNEDDFLLPFDEMFARGIHHENELLLDNIENDEIDDFLDDRKVSEEQVMAHHDQLLESSNHMEKHSSVINKIPQEQLSKFEILQRSWVLCGKVLKNVEDLEDGALKDRAYRNTIICSLLFLKLTTLTAEEILKNEIESEDEQIQFYKFFIRFSLLLHQNMLFSVMGTSKLLPVIEDYVNNDESKYSNVELFTSIFMMIDSGAENFKDLFNQAVQNNMSSAVREFVLAKLQILDSNTKNEELEVFYRTKINQLVKRNFKGKHVITKQKALNRRKDYTNKRELVNSIRGSE